MCRTIMTTDGIKQMDMVTVLEQLGHRAIKIVRDDYWYLSPFRSERTASFKINRRLNAWYDHGEGCGGNLVDFAVKYFQCSVKEVLKKFSEKKFTLATCQHMNTSDTQIDSPKIKIQNIRPLTNPALTHYLQERRISLTIARQFCKEVDFSLHNKSYYAIGFKNDLGGYELRNAFFKGSASPKTSTFFDKQNPTIKVFEGFFSFLSYMTIYENQPEEASSFMVLNSLAFFEKQKYFLEKFAAIHLYLDNDRAGKTVSQRALTSSAKFRDESHLYAGYKDLNEWHRHIGKAPHSRQPTTS